jgi:prolyl oligopeptidase
MRIDRQKGDVVSTAVAGAGSRGMPVVGAMLTAAMAAACGPSYPPPPDTRVEIVVDTLHGVPIADPYRWLEDRDAPETRAWINAQNEYAELIVGRTPLRDHMEERLGQLMDIDDAGSPRKAGDYQYFTLRRSGEDLPILYRRPVPGDEEEARRPIDPAGDYEVVLDPHTMDAEHTTRVSMVGFSDDGSLMIYSVRDGGEDEQRIRVRDLETGVDLPDSLPWSLYGNISFSPDDGGFYYVRRSREVGPRVLYHALGTDTEDDRLIFGDGYEPTAFINLNQADEGRYLIFGVQHGWARTEVHFQDVESGGGVQTLVDDVDARFYSRFIEGELYMRTDLEADRNRLVAVDLGAPARENWREVIPEGDDVMENFTWIDDKLYVTYLNDASNQIRVFEKDGTPAGEVPIPEFNSASIRGGDDGEAFLTLASFTSPSVTYRVDLETGEREEWDRREVDWDPEGVVVEQVWRTSSDGTRAPMWVIHHEDVELNGQNPTLLTGYGGFYVARKPGFSTTAAAWLEMGGVYAVATLRGGSEYGESWHRDGMLLNKQHVFDDFISAAEWLIDSGYTTPDRLAIQGGSNGGLLVASAFTQRPELFRAVVCTVPDIDILRFFKYTRNNNAPAMLEYGSSEDRDQFEAIRAFSPYQNVREGTDYPAVMFATGDLDTRVPPLAARKTTARMQAATTSGLPVILRYHPKRGHAAGGGLPMSRRIVDTAMQLTFLLQQLGVEWPSE